MSFFKSVVNVFKKLINGVSIQHDDVGTLTVRHDPNTNRLEIQTDSTGINRNRFYPPNNFIQYLDRISHSEKALLFYQLLVAFLPLLPPPYNTIFQPILKAFQEYGLGRYSLGEFLATLYRFKEISPPTNEVQSNQWLMNLSVMEFDDNPRKAILQLTEQLAIAYVSQYSGSQKPSTQDYYNQLIGAILSNSLEEFTKEPT